MSKTNEQLQDDITRLVYALGLTCGTVFKHKLDIEDEAFEELMDELITISTEAIISTEAMENI